MALQTITRIFTFNTKTIAIIIIWQQYIYQVIINANLILIFRYWFLA